MTPTPSGPTGSCTPSVPGRAARPILLAALLCLASSLPVAADPTARPDDEARPDTSVDAEIVVTAHHTSTPARETGPAVTVIDREQIERRHARSLLELLRAVPGLEIVQGGGPGKVASVFLRGASPGQTLVRLDGAPVNGPAAGLADLADISPLDVERIEILRGPQSGLYGAEAMGGVISIFTRPGGPGTEISAEVEAGTHDLERGAVRLGGGSGPWSWRLAAEETSTDAVSSASEAAGNEEADPWRNRTVAASSRLELPREGELALSVRHAEGDTAIDGFGFANGAFRPVDDPNARQLRNVTWTSLNLRQPVGDRWTQTVRIGWTDERLEGEDPDTFFNNFRLDSSVLEAETRADVEISETTGLSAGLEWEERSARDADAFDEEVELASGYLEGRWSWRQTVFLTGAVRHDDHSTFGGETTGRVTGSWLLSSSEDSGRSVRLHGSWGSGFRAPSFYDLFFPGFSNPDLAPETSVGGDLGAEMTFANGRASIDVTRFQNDFEDLIILDGAFVPQNLGEARARGWEVVARAEPTDDVHVGLSWTRTDSEDLATGLPLPRRPKDRWTADVAWDPIDRVRTTLSAFLAEERFDTGGAAMDDILRVDLTIEARLLPRWSPWVRVENLLDDDAEEIPGFTTPGRVVAVGVGWSLR